MKDARKKAVMKLKDKGKSEVYKTLRERKKSLSPEAYKEYEKNMLEMMGMEPSDEIKKMDKEEQDFRERIMRRKGRYVNN